MKPRCLLVVFSACVFCVAAAAETVEEKFPNGKVKIRYVTDKEGRKQGVYTEFTEKGQKKLTAVYKDDKLHGALSHYENGKPIWTQAFKDDQPAYSRTLAQIKKALAGIEPDRAAKAETPAEERDAALRRLKAYRYLAGVPYQNVVLDPEMNKRCEAAAKLCEMIGRLDHTPDNPGLPEKDYKYAYSGTSSSNLGRGDKDLRDAVDGWMNDSGDNNLDHVGHRRWCLNPQLQKTGFGRSGIFNAMWSFDRSLKIVPDFHLIAYPNPGYMPVEYFRANNPWSVTFHPQKYIVTKTAKPSLFKVDELLNKTEPVKLEYAKLSFEFIAIANCVIFRPEAFKLTPGSRYVVEIDGLALLTGALLPTQRYLVEFASLGEAEASK